MPERIPVLQTGYVHVFSEYTLLFCMRKKAGRADFLHEKADADREGA